MRIATTDTPAAEDRAAVLDPLVAFNEARVGPSGRRDFAALLRDESGAAVGGAIAVSGHGWMYLELLHIPESLRGQGWGERLVAAVEQEARARGCVGVHLWTGTFQAPGFYERLGFTRYGTLPDSPPGHAVHFYLKRLDGESHVQA